MTTHRSANTTTMIARTLLCIYAVFFALAVNPVAGAQGAIEDDRLSLQEYQDKQIEGGRISKGSYRVYEDRAAEDGREIHLSLVILHALSDQPQPDPVFIFQGGPGQAAAGNWAGFRHSWMRRDRDIVLISQRGTDGDNRLDIDLPGSDDDIQGYMNSAFDLEPYERGIKELQEQFDLTKYSTPLAADDFNEIRNALGYETINITGGSYGTRMALVYMRRHPHTVRSAILSGVAPLSFTNPLYHAQSAQDGLELILDECENDPKYKDAYGNLRAELNAVLDRLAESPVDVVIDHPATGQPVTVQLSRGSFTGALRVMMYYMDSNRRVPLAIHQAYEGDFREFATIGLRSVRGIQNALAFGMLMCVTTAEDIARIDPELIEPLTKDSIFGDERVRSQMKIAAIWPKSKLPANFGDPVSVDIPVLLFSGLFDPVTPPRWGERAAGHLPNSLHVIVPTAHDVGGGCVESIKQQFLADPTPAKIDTSCVAAMKVPPLVMSEN